MKNYMGTGYLNVLSSSINGKVNQLKKTKRCRSLQTKRHIHSKGIKRYFMTWRGQKAGAALLVP